MNTIPEHASNVFLIRDGRVCLAYKKGSIHLKNGKEIKESKLTLNGYGGKFDLTKGDKTICDTALRELKEESGVTSDNECLVYVGFVSFFWKGNQTPVANMQVDFFLLYEFEGTPQESDEAGPPEWFLFDEVPYTDRLMPADKLFLPQMLREEEMSGSVYFFKDKPPIFVPLS